MLHNRANQLVNMQMFFNMLQNREKNFNACVLLMNAMQKVINATRDFQNSKTPESEALARWNKADAISDLTHLWHAWCLTDEEKTLIRNIIKSSV